MQNDLYFIINQFASQLKKQDGKLAKLEKANAELHNTIENLKNQNPIHIERIDYHFDQLKIEKLDGTLNIGINPSDLQDMDELSIPTPTQGTNVPKNQMPPAPFRDKQNLTKQLQERLHDYLDKELQVLVQDKKQEMNLVLDESYTNFIKEDIRKQLPSRIQFYIQKVAQENRNLSHEEEEQEVFHRIVMDIQQAIHAFLQQFPMEGEGEKPNDHGSN